MSKHLEPWTDGSPVEGGERRWSMYWLTPADALPESRFETAFEPYMACDTCKHDTHSVPSAHEPCASCTVRPSNWEER
jgi:hypothetical protein